MRKMLLSQKKSILINFFDSANQRVQPTVPTFFLLSDTDQSRQGPEQGHIGGPPGSTTRKAFFFPKKKTWTKMNTSKMFY